MEAIFADDTNLFLFHLPNLLIENINSKREHVRKALGVFIDENLSWKQHIDIVSSKVSKRTGILYF